MNAILNSRKGNMSLLTAFFLFKISGVPVSFANLKKLKKEKQNFRSIVDALIIHNKAKLKCDRQRIIDYWKTGGNPKNIVYGILTALKQNQVMTLTNAIKKDKQGIDIAKEIIELGNKN